MGLCRARLKKIICLGDVNLGLQFSDYVALTALTGSGAGWLLSYLHTNKIGKQARKSARLDEVEGLAFSLSNSMVMHLLLPGDDEGATGRMMIMQSDASRLRAMINDIFDRNIPSDTQTRLTTLWEQATSEPVTLSNRQPLNRYSVEICQIQSTPTALVNSARKALCH